MSWSFPVSKLWLTPFSKRVRLNLMTLLHSSEGLISHTYSKRHNKFLFPSPAKAIYGSFCRAENEIFNVVNYKSFN